MKILAVFPGRIGDALFFTSTIRLLKTDWEAVSNKPIEIDWVYGSPMLDGLVNDLLKHTDLPVHRYIPHRYGYPGDIKVWRIEDWKKRYPGYDMYINATLDQAPPWGMHLVEWIPRKAGIIPAGRTLLPPMLQMSFGPKGSGDNKILVHPWIHSTERNSDHLLKLNSSYDDSPVCSIGHQSELMGDGAKDYRGCSYSHYIDLVRSARLVVGVSSSFTLLAAIVGTPSIVVHTATTPANCGIERFGPHCLDLVRPTLYDINASIDTMLRRNSKRELLSV